MKTSTSLRAQRGATLVTGLILMTMLMLSVSVAFLMSNSNLKAVGNMQFRAEAEAAAAAAVETLISTDTIFLTPAVTTVPTDERGIAVTIAQPVCVKSVPVAGGFGDQNTGFFEDGAPPAALGFQATDWDIVATATNAATGASVETHQGVKIVLPAEPNPCP
ncbi:MAG: hypothetical protein Q8K21_07830 [Hydrogenophaga sp.]|uniref:hypothetical protein n=1 Tax=Hydrogenophaga sp. TaxID=1904254 RepID=UPI00273026C2|nr:hypothetical protein [Hydrogenophaga sp.]MDP2164117.1 hypothetical protein [Hydrogenophaga sp.]MDP3475043.1 hypothetical protein [Hydrogenophaga sp.]